MEQIAMVVSEGMPGRENARQNSHLYLWCLKYKMPQTYYKGCYINNNNNNNNSNYNGRWGKLSNPEIIIALPKEQVGMFVLPNTASTSQIDHLLSEPVNTAGIY